MDTLTWYGKKQNLTQQKHTFTNQNKCTTTQNKQKKLKLGIVTSYDIRPKNGKGLFLFRRFINLSPTYLLRHLPLLLTAPDPHGAHTKTAKWTKAIHACNVQLQFFTFDICDDADKGDAVEISIRHLTTKKQELRSY